MGQAIPRQHPAVVLRSQFNMVRALLAVAMIAVVGLSVAVVILAGEATTAQPAATGSADPATGTGSPVFSRQAPELRYDGGPNEGTAGIGR
jgi:hypothetical protein